MTYGFVENQTTDPLEVSTFAEIDLILQAWPTTTYTLAPGETRAVFSWGIRLVNLHLNASKAGWRLSTGQHLRVKRHRSGNLDVQELTGQDFSNLRLPLLSRRSGEVKEAGTTRLIQPGEQVCTKAAQQTPFAKAMRHGIVTSCSRHSIQVAYFSEDGVKERELFGVFTSFTDVWLVDYWDQGQGLDQSAAPLQVTVDRANRQLNHPNLQPRFDSSNFNSEHWATRMKADINDADGFSSPSYELLDARFVWVKE